MTSVPGVAQGEIILADVAPPPPDEASRAGTASPADPPAPPAAMPELFWILPTAALLLVAALVIQHLRRKSGKS